MPGKVSIRWSPTSLSKLLESILYHWDIVPNDAQASAMAADIGEGVTANAIKSKISILKRKSKSDKPGKKVSPVKPSARKLTPLSPSVSSANRVTKRQRTNLHVVHSSEDESPSNQSVTLDEGDAEAEASETASGEENENGWKSDENGTDATDDQDAGVQKKGASGAAKRTASARRSVKKVDYKALNGESTTSEDEVAQSQDWWLKDLEKPLGFDGEEDDEDLV